MCIYCSIKDIVEGCTPIIVTFIICATLVLLAYSCEKRELAKNQQMMDAGYTLETVQTMKSEVTPVTSTRWVKSTSDKKSPGISK